MTSSVARRYISGCFVLVMLLAVPASARSEPVTVPPTSAMLTLADNLTAVLSEDSGDVWWLMHWRTRVYLKFVLPDLPAGTEFMQAQLRLSVTSGTQSSPIPRISAHYGQGVDLGAITGEFPVEPGPTAAPHLGRQFGYQDNWDVSSFVEGQFGSEVLIVVDPPAGVGSNWAYFFAHEGHADDGLRSVLIIEFASPVPTSESSFGQIKALY